jgi:hypothetical protein
MTTRTPQSTPIRAISVRNNKYWSKVLSLKRSVSCPTCSVLSPLPYLLCPANPTCSVLPILPALSYLLYMLRLCHVETCQSARTTEITQGQHNTPLYVIQYPTG